MGEETNSLLNVSESEAFIQNYKAVYQAMTAKNDCRSKIFPRNVKVTIDDIYALNDQVVEKLKNYSNAGFSISVNASFAGRQMIEFSSWQEFENHKWSENAPLNSLTIIWEFNAILPNYKVPQKHVLVVKIADGLRPQEMLNIVFAGKLENMDDIDKQMYPVVARVDFINYVLGDELLHIVEEWNKSLTLQEDVSKPFVNFLKRHRRKVAFLINYGSCFVFLLCCLHFFTYILHSYDVEKLADLTINSSCNIVDYIAGIAILLIVVFKLSEWIANSVFRTLGSEMDYHVFDINRGDSQIQNNIHSQYSKNIRSVIWSIIWTFLTNLICAIICSYIVH